MDTKVDRITNLPECVTSNILSRIPTIEVVRTCVLSRDWEHNWASIYDIDVNDGCVVDDTDECFSRALFDLDARLASFNSFMDKVFGLNRELSVRNACLDLGSISHNSHNIETWISRIVSLRAKNLSLVARNIQHDVVLPKILVCSATLTELKLVLECTLNVRVLNCFPQLESLHLSGGSDGDIRIINKQFPKARKLFLSLAALKNLELERFVFMNAKLVEINVPELVNFKAYSAVNPCDYLVKIHAPKLMRFVTAKGPVCEFVQCILSLYDMDISVGIVATAPQVIALLNGAQNLKRLRLTWEAVVMWKSVRVLPTFYQLKRLELPCTSENVLYLFLHAAPYLESLVLSTIYGSMQSQQSLQPCDVSRLKEVHFTCMYGNSWQTALAKAFIENGKNLENVFFHLTGFTRIERDALISRTMIALGPDWSRVTVL